MKVNTKSLHAALSSLRSIVGSRQTLPVLSCVKLECQFARLTISASNIDCWKSVVIDCDGSIPTVCVNLNHFLVLLGDAEVTELEASKTNLQIMYGPSVYKIGIIDAEDFPKSHSDDPMTKTGLSCQDVADGVNAVSWAASKDVTRVNLCSVHIYSSDKMFTCEAADGRNGAFFDRALICPTINLLIPDAFSRDFSEALKVKGASFSCSENAVMVQHDHGLIWFKQVDAKYPNYTTRSGYKIRSLGKLDVKQLSFVIGQCCALADANIAPCVHLSFSKTGLRITFSGAGGSSVDKIVQGEFGDCETDANANSLLSCLKGIGSDQCDLSCEDGEPTSFLALVNGDLKIFSMAMRPK